MYLLRWILHRTVRQGGELLGIVRKHFEHQRDILPEKNRLELEGGIATYEKTLKDPATTMAQLKQAGTAFEELAHKWLKSYPFAAYRDNFESLLGTVVIIFAFKTFFATPMEIPTGSAQPTFNGITFEDLRDKPEVKIPTGFQRIWERWVKGHSYYEVIAEADGEIEGFGQPSKQIGFGKLGLGKRIDLRVGGRTYPIRWAPDDHMVHLGLFDPPARTWQKSSFKRGEPIVRCRVATGDRLFVERLTYNFRKPRRGDYFVFQSTGMPAAVTPGTHYIKRLIAFGGEKVRIGDDRHVYINGRALGTNDRGFEKVYSFDPAKAPVDSQYSGHVNGATYARAYKQWLMSTPHAAVPKDQLEAWAEGTANQMAPAVGHYFPDAQAEFTVRPNCYLGFGDNTMSSSDGRHWGDVPREKVVGKSLFVMWPFTSRWGW
jgi:signal peptidase I